MKIRPVSLLVIAAFLSACVSYDPPDQTRGTITKDGFSFRYVHTWQDQFVAGNPSPRPVDNSYTITFPDGTTRTVFHEDEGVAYGKLEDAIDNWVKQSTIAGPPEDPEDVIEISLDSIRGGD